jgi:uncharacterized protein DUF4082/List-Bact-rpt repeat protein
VRSPDRLTRLSRSAVAVACTHPVLGLTFIVTLATVVLGFDAGLAGAAQLTATWTDNSGGTAQFRVERKTGTSGLYAEIAITATGATSYVDPTIAAGTTYCYRVRASNAAGNSAYSNDACAAVTSAFDVTVARAGTGAGTVVSSPIGINCGADCFESFGAGALVTLTAAPGSGSAFVGWSGGGCSGTAACVTSGNIAVTVTATFSTSPTPPPSDILTVTKSGTGAGTVTSTPAGISCGSVCATSVTAGTTATLTAVPATGSTFSGWRGGGCGGTGTCTVTVSSATSVDAAFTAATTTMYRLEVRRAGTGSGTVVSVPAGISCGADCSHSYPNGTNVTLSASAAPGSRFTGWTGNRTCRDGVVGMSANHRCTANFVSDSSSAPPPAVSCPCSIWPSSATPAVAADPDTNAVELGVKFRADVDGYITGIRFYKTSVNGGAHVGNLWSSSGRLLATVAFTGETSSGWQQTNFSAPVLITANTTYVASYHTSTGRYSATSAYFSTGGVDTAPLHALSNVAAGGNGVYSYRATSGFPGQTYNASNYWVDVVFIGR